MSSEKEKMLAGQIYNCIDAGLYEELSAAYALCLRYNALRKDQVAERKEVLKLLFPDAPETLYVNGPIFLDFGSHTHFGNHVYANSNLTILDEGDVTIGNDVFIGPNVSLLTPLHPLLKEERRRQIRGGKPCEYVRAKPITIGDDVWLGAGVIVLPGVHIGSGSVIGAGSVVTKDIPSDVLAFGNPCRVIRPLTPEDSILPKKISE